MTKSREPPDWVRCYVCKKRIRIADRRRLKKINGSDQKNDILQVRELRDGRWVCSDVCFNLAIQPPSDPFDID